MDDLQRMILERWKPLLYKYIILRLDGQSNIIQDKINIKLTLTQNDTLNQITEM